jgi:quinoprotein glucose dehydrogenase
MRISYVLVLAPAVVGAVLGGIAYVRHGSGVDGTAGALLALIGALAVTGGALLAMLPRLAGWFRVLLDILLALGAALTAVAAWFLMQDAFAVMMALALAGLIVTLIVPGHRRTT